MRTDAAASGYAEVACNSSYEVFVNGDPRVQQTLVLRAGEVQTERIVVR